MTTAETAKALGCYQPHVYRYAQQVGSKLVRVKVAGKAHLYETWSVHEEAGRIRREKDATP
jgi:hypothetical protein